MQGLLSSQAYENSNVSEPTTPTKQSAVIDRLSSLSDKLNQGEYSPSKISAFAEPCIDARVALKIILTGTLFMFGSQLKQQDYHHLSVVKPLWFIALFSYFYSFPPKSARSLNRQFAMFFILRLLSSSVVYSLMTGHHFSYDAHVLSGEHDALVNLFLTMVVALFVGRDMSAIKLYLTVQFAGYLVTIGALQLWYGRVELTVILHQIALFVSLINFCQLLFSRMLMDQRSVQTTVAKHCENICQEINDIKDKLEQEEQTTQAVSLHTTKVDELITKIRYLKFSLLQKEKEKIFVNNRPIFTNSRRRTYNSKVQPSGYGHNESKFEDYVILNDCCAESKSNTPKNSFNSRLTLTTEDCDNLLKLVLEKQVVMWYPEVLKAEDDQVCRETADFLKQHFTELESSLLKLNAPTPSKYPYIMESSTSVNNPWNTYLEANITNWNFDMLKFKELTNGNHMIEFGNAIVKKFNVLKSLNITSNIMNNFLREVSHAYHPNPYHNSMHGADVCNGVSYFLANTELGSNLNELETSALLISALVHDIGHPGVNNAFLIATRSTEALLYNDQSVLENYHLASFFKILQKSSTNILQNLSESDYKIFRKLAISLILDTDLTKHFIILTKFKNITEKPNFAEENDKLLTMSIALKCADVAHGAKELNLHKKWSRRITEEFYLQGDKELENNIPITPSCSRTANIAKGQQGFLNFIVMPLFEAFDQRLFNEQNRIVVTSQITKNLEYWVDEASREEKQEHTFMKETQKVLEEIAFEATNKN